MTPPANAFAPSGVVMQPNCSAVDVSMQTLCMYTNMAYTPPTPVCTSSSYYDSTSSMCIPYDSPVAKSAALLGGDITASYDAGNTAWMLGASALVMIMTPGVGLFYAGLAGAESASNTIMMSFATMCLVTVQWFLFGYSFAFGPSGDGTLGGWGSFQWGCFQQLLTNSPSGVYGYGIPHVIYAAFQCMFAMITPALISGAIVSRMRFDIWLLFVFLWATLIYDALAHWVWSWTLDDNFALVPQGWLAHLGALDFAGGTVIHISSGFAALAAAIVVGKRKTDKQLKAHNVPMVVIGATLLWFGWFGFNAGSAAGAFPVPQGPGAQATIAFWNTHLATAAAALSWMACERVFDGFPTAIGASVGAVAGLVAITPACGFVNAWAALIIGLAVSPFCYAAAKLKAKFGPDDTLDSFAVHGIGGAVGAFMTGLFANPEVNTFAGAFYGNPMQLGYQMAAITVSASYSFFGTIIILLALKHIFGGLRISEDAEAAGVDLSEHGGAGPFNPKKAGGVVYQQEVSKV